MDHITNELSLESQRVEEDCEYSSKGHFEAALRWRRIHYWIGIPAAVFAALASISAFGQNTIVAGLLAILVAAMGAIATFLNPSGKATEHMNSANQYLSLRNRARIFRNIDVISLETSESRKALISLAEQKDKLNASSPQIPDWAYKKARANIIDGQTRYRADDP